MTNNVKIVISGVNIARVSQCWIVPSAMNIPSHLRILHSFVNVVLDILLMKNRENARNVMKIALFVKTNPTDVKFVLLELIESMTGNVSEHALKDIKEMMIQDFVNTHHLKFKDQIKIKIALSTNFSTFITKLAKNAIQLARLVTDSMKLTAIHVQEEDICTLLQPQVLIDIASHVIQPLCFMVQLESVWKSAEMVLTMV